MWWQTDAQTGGAVAALGGLPAAVPAQLRVYPIASAVHQPQPFPVPPPAAVLPFFTPGPPFYMMGSVAPFAHAAPVAPPIPVQRALPTAMAASRRSSLAYAPSRSRLSTRPPPSPRARRAGWQRPKRAKSRWRGCVRSELRRSVPPPRRPRHPRTQLHRSAQRPDTTGWAAFIRRSQCSSRVSLRQPPRCEQWLGTCVPS